MTASLIRRPFVVLGIAALAAAGSVVPIAAPVVAQTVAQSQIVSANPADFTPNILDGKVNAIVQVGQTVIAAGSFTKVQAAGSATTLTRTNIVAFNATTGAISTGFAPNVAGQVYDLEAAGDGTSVYVVGSFTQVNGTPTSRVARLDVTNGQKVAGFAPATISGAVKNVDLVGGRLLIGGSFKKVGTSARTSLASLDPANGSVTGFLNLPVTGVNNGGTTSVLKMAVSPDGSKLVAIGNFTAVAGQTRLQIAMVDLTGATAALSTWSTSIYTNSCASVFDTYTRDLDFAPDSSYFVVSTTGAYGGPDSPCDVVTRWESSATGAGQEPTWRDYTGGDTTYAVAVTGAAVYVGGHMRWENNAYAGDSAGPGAVPREGIAALDPVNGLPLSWNPGRARGVGVFDMLATSTGLWVGSDTGRIGGETHNRIAFFPLVGGATLPAQLLGATSNDVYLLGRTGAAADPGVLYRINAGGPALQSADDGPDWISDGAAVAAGYTSGHHNTAGWSPVPTVNSSVPATATDRAPRALFASEAWGPDSGADEMGWHLPVAAGTPVTVRLYLANRCDCTSSVGGRVYNISVEGSAAATNLDLVSRFGDQVGAMISTDVVVGSDGDVDIDVTHLVENPLVNGIEIVLQGSQGGGGGGFTAADQVDRRFFTGSSAGPTTTLSPTTVAWSLVRGAFLVDNTLYTGSADGTFAQRTFNGTTFGAAAAVPLYASTFTNDIPNLTGIVYSHGRIYYTLFGSDDLHWRWFSPQSAVVGAVDFVADGDVSALDPGTVQGLLLSGTTLYAVDRGDGSLRALTLSGTTVSGPATTLDTGDDWRARATFLWNGTPA